MFPAGFACKDSRRPCACWHQIPFLETSIAAYGKNCLLLCLIISRRRYKIVCSHVSDIQNFGICICWPWLRIYILGVASRLQLPGTDVAPACSVRDVLYNEYLEDSKQAGPQPKEGKSLPAFSQGLISQVGILSVWAIIVCMHCITIRCSCVCGTGFDGQLHAILNHSVTESDIERIRSGESCEKSLCRCRWSCLLPAWDQIL
jgi:hypothetical protein